MRSIVITLYIWQRETSPLSKGLLKKTIVEPPFVVANPNNGLNVRSLLTLYLVSLFKHALWRCPALSWLWSRVVLVRGSLIRRNRKTCGLKHMINFVFNYGCLGNFSKHYEYSGKTLVSKIRQPTRLLKMFMLIIDKIKLCYLTLLLPEFSKIPNDISSRKSCVEIT